jgi:HEAT repeat protein
MSNSLQLSKESIKIAQEAFRRKYPSQEALADKLSEVYQCTVTRQPIGRFLKGQSISRQIFVWICEALDLDVDKVVKPLREPKSETTAIDYWQQVCREMLEAQKQNLRRQITQMGFELNIHVPLGLVDRKQQSRRSTDFSLPPEQGSGFFQLSEEEIIKTYEHNEFLEQVIKQGQSKNSQGKRIAIIGEPGAGKTTLLEAIAFSPKTPGFPIWIALGSLGDKSLEEYLCQKWLKDALKTSDITQQQKQLEELFKSGEVLLLLDGVDEMSAPSPVEALAKIRDELTGCVAGARVVLTCRVNVWDASVNALQGFDTYRTLEFSYGDGNQPDQVREFICQWFSKADKPELGEPLREKLDEDRHQRIRDLVKNPLRLSLLCQSLYWHQGDLPKTKAALYEQFTRAFYDWKEDAFRTTLTERKQLNAALGMLAREAIDKEKSRFGIRESFAIALMGEDLFNLACKLHWLNFVYKDAETDEKVYAFFHPTFQEYFAAFAINDWHFFLNHVLYNPAQGTYRIFEPQWKEVFLLWLGREEDESFRLKKELLIGNLAVFEDGCGNFYEYRAVLLAAAGLAEFKDCGCADLIVSLLFSLGFGCDEWSRPISDDPIAEAARKTIPETNRAKAINKLIDLIDNRDDIVPEAVEILEEIAIGNKQAINTLIRLIETSEDQDICEFVAGSLEKIGAGNQRAVDELLRLLKTSENKNIHELAAYSLEKIAIGNRQAIDDLIIIITTTEDENKRWEAAYVLAQINPGNEKALEELIRIIENTKDDDIFRKVAWNLGRLNTVNQMVIDVLTRLILTTKGQPLCWEVPWSLGKIITGNQQAFDALIGMFLKSEDKNIFSQTNYKIAEDETGGKEVIKALLKLLEEVTSEPLKQNISIHNLQLVITELEQSIAREKEIEALVSSIRELEKSSIEPFNEIFRTYQLHSVVTVFKKRLFNDNEDEIVIANKFIWSCAYKMNYPDFYDAWHGQPHTIHP